MIVRKKYRIKSIISNLSLKLRLLSIANKTMVVLEKMYPVAFQAQIPNILQTTDSNRSEYYDNNNRQKHNGNLPRVRPYHRFQTALRK